MVACMKNHNLDYENKLAKSKLQYEIEIATLKMMAGMPGENYDRNRDI
jgi:hypothetical protein